MTDLDSLLDNIDNALSNGEVTITKMTRARITAKEITIEECFNTIQGGIPEACREPDRVKFVDEFRIVFVASGKKAKIDGTLVPHAFLISAFPQAL